MYKGSGGSRSRECRDLLVPDLPLLQLKRIIWDRVRQACESVES